MMMQWTANWRMTMDAVIPETLKIQQTVKQITTSAVAGDEMTNDGVGLKLRCEMICERKMTMKLTN